MVDVESVFVASSCAWLALSAAAGQLEHGEGREGQRHTEVLERLLRQKGKIRVRETCVRERQT